MTRYSTHVDPMWPLSPTIRVVAAAWFDHPSVEEGEWERPAGLLVGEQPRPGGNPKLPLWPWPRTSAGGRLFEMSRMPLTDYLRLLARTNVAHRPVARWNSDGARQRGLELLRMLPEGTRVVACGARARDALGIGEFWTPQHAFLDGSDVRMVAIPHPSGRCREYNQPGAAERAGRWVRWAARLGREGSRRGPD